MVIKSLILTLLSALLVGFTVLAMRHEYVGIRKNFADENYLQSKDCLSCHQDHFASWAKTHHSRMTQEARPQTLQGDFENQNTLEYLNVKARMEKRGDKFFMTFTQPNGQAQTFSVDRTVGSRRIEQYLSKQTGKYIRLPLAYDLLNRRWMNLNGSFFYPDGENFFQHQSDWDGNCVFCHNVKAQPQINFQTRQFNTEVSELGIACGACHGAAADHAEKASSPFTRTLWQFDREAEKNIVNPLKLSAERSMQICGHCHGQRIPVELNRIQEILQRGDPYNAGDDLAKIYQPVQRDTMVGNYSFANRFWANGSPRLTAYEYQGILRSKCFIEGDPKNKINCLTCHSMHGGDVKGQITEENRTNKPCLECHDEYNSGKALTEHTRHQADSSGSSCYSCHMPRVVYGVMSIHPTHDITVPNPQLTISQSLPNACNQCHLDKSVNWAIAQSRSLWQTKFFNLENHPDKQFDIPEGVRGLFSGDALTRGLMAESLGGGGNPHIDWRWSAPYLVEALTDNYPIVRYFAANGLAKINEQYLKNAGLEKPDYLGSQAMLQNSLLQWRQNVQRLNSQKPDEFFSLVQQLKSMRRDVDLEVGE
ncbi:MAG: cytochrome c3 family protein [Acidobacteriota bacterium]